MTKIPFAILVPIDLLDQSYAAKIFPGAQPTILKHRFEAASKLTILTTQLTWVMGNMSKNCRIEMFAGTLATRAPITGIESNEERQSRSRAPWKNGKKRKLATRISNLSSPDTAHET